MKYFFYFKIFMACLYILLGVLVISTPMGGFLANSNAKLAFSIVLICYGCYRAYTLSQRRKNENV